MKTRKTQKTRKFVALKARLAVEALLQENGLQPIVDDYSLMLRARISQSTLYFKEREIGQLELTLAVVTELLSAETLEERLPHAVPPPGTELQILNPVGDKRPVAVARCLWEGEADPRKIIHWAISCENIFLDEEAPDEDDSTETTASPVYKATCQTREALLDQILAAFGSRVRVDESEEASGYVSYGFPHGDAFFHLAILPATKETCRLNARICVGSLVSRHACAIEWLLANCADRLLTVRSPIDPSSDSLLEVGFSGYLPKGPSQAFSRTLARIICEVEVITCGLNLWFPNLIDGDLVGIAQMNPEDTERRGILLAVSDPEAFVKEREQFVLDYPEKDFEEGFLPYHAALWAGAYTTALQWGERLEKRTLAIDPSNQEEEKEQRDSLSFSVRFRIRALKALGRYEEALALLDAWEATEPSETKTALTRASLYVRLRRLEEAGEIVTTLGEDSGSTVMLTLALVLAGLGHEDEAQGALEQYENLVGPDIVARALFRKLQEEHAAKPDAADETSAAKIWSLQKPIDEEESTA